LSDRNQEIKAMNETMNKMAPLLEFVDSFENPDTLIWFFDSLKTDFLFKFLAEKGKHEQKEDSKREED